MTDSGYHVAQANIARGRGLIGSPVMAGFVERLEYINSVADRSPGGPTPEAFGFQTWFPAPDQSQAPKMRPFTGCEA